MKAFKVTFHHGHFIDLETKERIIPVSGAEFIITASPESFTKEDPRLDIGKPLDEENKKKWANRVFGKGKYHKLLPEGSKLFFRIGLSKKVHGDESRQYVFVCSLKEDLYMYLISDREGKDPEDWRLADCICILEDCILGGMALTTKLSAESINKLFSQTVMFYFNLQRSGSTNVFNTFCIYEPGMKIIFDSDYKLRYESLDKLRMRLVKGLLF